VQELQPAQLIKASCRVQRLQIWAADAKHQLVLSLSAICYAVTEHFVAAVCFITLQETT
jgi:hypothetical protein